MVTQQPRTGTRLEHVLALGVLAWRDKYLAWVRRHPLMVDAALVAALLLPLTWRRRAPFLVFMIISIAALAQLLTSQEVTNDLALLVAFYTTAAYQPPRRILAAAAILEAGAVLFAADNSRPGFTRSGSGSSPRAWSQRLRSSAATPVPGGRISRPWPAVPSDWSATGSGTRSSPHQPSGPGSRGRCTTSSRTISRS
jgi:hypothetical protein